MGRRIPVARSLLSAICLSLAAAAAVATPAGPPATRPTTHPASTRPAALLPQRWPGAAYDIRRDGHVVSRITFHNELARDDAGGPDRLRFTDTLVIDPAGKASTIRVTTVCQADDALTPVRVTAEEVTAAAGLAGGGTPVMDLRFERGLAVGTVRGEAAAIEAPPPVVTELTLFRVAVLAALAGPR